MLLLQFASTVCRHYISVQLADSLFFARAAPSRARAADLVSRLTLDEKVRRARRSQETCDIISARA